jgi:hypothetical protein
VIGARARRLSRRQRRLLVLAEYAGLFSVPMAFVLTENSWWSLLGLLGVLAAVLIHDRLLLRFTQKIANKADADLDERQTAVRDNAHRAAYQILGTSIIVVLALVQMMTTGPLADRPWTPQISVQSVVVPASTTFLWMYVTLPTAVIAWREPDPDPDE